MIDAHAPRTTALTDTPPLGLRLRAGSRADLREAYTAAVNALDRLLRVARRHDPERAATHAYLLDEAEHVVIDFGVGLGVVADVE